MSAPLWTWEALVAAAGGTADGAPQGAITGLSYDGQGSAVDHAWQITGHATAGDVDLVLDLTVTAIGTADEPMREIELVGSADVGTVHLPLPGLGTVEDFSFDVDARLAMRPHRS